MLSKDKRLNLKKDFRWVAAGEKVANSSVGLFFRFGDNPYPKVGIAVSKANFKKAVERNRVRRLVSRGFELLYSQLPPNINIVVLPKPDILKLRADKIARSLEMLLSKVKYIKKKDNEVVDL